MCVHVFCVVTLTYRKTQTGIDSDVGQSISSRELAAGLVRLCAPQLHVRFGAKVQQGLTGQKKHGVDLFFKI